MQCVALKRETERIGGARKGKSGEVLLLGQHAFLYLVLDVPGPFVKFVRQLLQKIMFGATSEATVAQSCQGGIHTRVDEFDLIDDPHG